jgi:hypothetical protein
MFDCDKIGWQQAWGGMFVEALRTISSRCLCMALFLLDKNDLSDVEKASVQSDILEALGLAKYTELMGSQVYGYPMRPLSDFKKRELAEASHLCFNEAVRKVENDETQVTYDLLFMAGKCSEKIAKTYSGEAFPGEDSNGVRSYERHMETALLYYHRSLKEAISLEEEGALPDPQAGGSSHGRSEVFYRLHATRLKCLLSAVQHHEDTRPRALNEAIRLAKKHWYDSEGATDDLDTRSLIWKLLADVVAALAQCRLDQHFFHRSVYRYAQALMWAPVFHDPATGFVEGSLGVVPATKSHLLRGLNSSTACANSAEVIMATLFEKKRPQIASVWVTHLGSSSAPFEIINGSNRKFDSLRGKYLHAYIETLRLCKRSSILESLFQQVAASKRDLTSFFQASAASGGRMPGGPHVKESLLRKGRASHTVGLLRDVKREINRSIASIIIQGAPTTDKNSEMFKNSYVCFLRLNTTVEEIVKMRSWKYGSGIQEAEALCQLFLRRSESRGLQFESSGWSGESKKSTILKAAVERCAELFPGLLINLYRRSKPKKPSLTKPDTAEKKSKKRDSPEESSSLIHFVLDVPSGLAVGEKFETTVRVGSKLKTVRLTVPEGRPAKLKFSLSAPDEEQEDEPQEKRPKE